MKMIFLLVFASILLLAITSGCVVSEKPSEKAQYTDISVQQAKGMIDRGEVFILDVRTPEEYDAGHINSSKLIPLQVLDKRLDEIPRDRKLLVYCRTGHRSAQASEILVNNGFTQVYNMKGGIIEWTGAGYDTEK